MHDIFNEPILLDIAKKYNKTVSQIVLNYIWFELGVVVIPKTEKIERLKDNFNWFDFKLS